MKMRAVILILVLVACVGAGLFWWNSPSDERVDLGTKLGEIEREEVTEEDINAMMDEILGTTGLDPGYEVVWTGETMRLIAGCDIVECEYIYQWLEGTDVEFPEEINDYFRWGFSSTQSPDESFFVYVDDVTVNSLDVATMESTELFTLYEDTDGYDFMGWSPSGNKLAFVAINQNSAEAGGHEDHPEGTKLFILTFEDGEMVAKDKYNFDIAWTCGSRCFVFGEAFEWIDDNTIEYSTQEDLYFGDYGDEVEDLPRYQQYL